MPSENQGPYSYENEEHEPNEESHTGHYPSEISVHDCHNLIQSDEDMILVDCREPREHSICHIEGSILVPMDEISERVGELEEYREKRIVVHCHHGGRSLRVVNWLRNHGFDTAQNMTGGIDVWSQEIDPDVPRY